MVIDKIISKYTLGDQTPGFSVLISQNDNVIYQYNLGVRDNASHPIDSHSNFRLASITKQFTAVAILQLIQKGTLSLATTLTELFPVFPEYGTSITIEHLLTHTSGLKDYESDLDVIASPQISDEQVLSFAKQQMDTLFRPGSRYQYSNGGYCLLALVVEKISGVPFGAYVEKEIFARAEMKNARLNTAQEIPNRVYGFTSKSDGAWELNDQSKTSATQGDGGIYSSAQELILWQKHLFKERTLIAQPYLYLMIYPQVKTDENDEQYGFGVVISHIAGQPCYHHMGESIGFSNALFYFPKQDLSVAILSNLGGIDIMKFGRDIIEGELLRFVSRKE